jgi:phosphoribosylglycinamide formyltransferase-1
MKIGILISGRGSNMTAIAEAVANGVIPGAEVSIVISNKKDAPGIVVAENMGLETRVIERDGSSREEHDRKIVSVLRDFGVELVCLAGYMRLLSPYFVSSFRNRIVNIHPSLLPSFPGVDAVRQAIEYGVKTTGCTVHFVDEELDHGPIIEQIVVEISDKDDEESLSARVLKAEHTAYVSALQKIVSNRIVVSGRTVKMLER